MSAFRPEDFVGDPVAIARRLLGARLVHDTPEGRLAGRIVETEAYVAATDPACHGFRGVTPRSAPLFGPPGTAYLYLIYGMHVCFNVVVEPAGVGAAILVRALEPVEGLEAMARRRSSAKALTDGPGKLAQALGLTLGMNGRDLLGPGASLRLEPGEPVEDAGYSGRIGITKGTELPWRFFERGNRWVSRTPPCALRAVGLAP